MTPANYINVIVDLSHHNGAVDLAVAQQAGLVGMIHKATQGLTYVDPMFQANTARARELGLLVGAYHFGVAADGTAQAEHFLATVGDAPTLLALDLEHNPSGECMTPEQARQFVTHIHSKTGRWPGLYSGDYIKTALGAAHDATFANCWFWLAEYAPTPVIPPNWQAWTLWQYTNGTKGNPPHEMAGIGPCDRSLFAGDEEALRKFWIPA